MMREKKKFNGDGQDSTNPYKTDFLSKIPSWLKILILKYWAAAAAVFFIGIGGPSLGLDWSLITEENASWMEIQLAITFYILMALFLALLMNYIVKMFAMMMNNSRDNTKRFLFVTRKGFLGFLFNLGYHFLLMIPIYFLTIVIAKYDLLPSIFGSDTSWGLEPFSMGLFYVAVDFVFVFVKNLIVYAYKRHMIHKINTSE